MLPVMGGRAPRRPKGVLPHIVLRLRPGWRYDPAKREFVAPGDGAVFPQADLPTGWRVVPSVPGLADDPQEALSEAERELARYYQVILPRRADPAAALTQVRQWPCLEEAYPGPEVSLPE